MHVRVVLHSRGHLTVRFCTTLACALLVLWKYVQILWCIWVTSVNTIMSVYRLQMGTLRLDSSQQKVMQNAERGANAQLAV